MRLATRAALATGILVGAVASVQAYEADDLTKLKNGNTCAECDLAGLLAHEMDLSGAVLAGSNLTAASFTSANLTNADLSNATLASADFGEADLTGANLRGANVNGATFWNTDLTDANLRNVNMDDARVVAVRYCNTTMPSGTVRKPDCGD
jgi:uncharacterized protein YjbI with pentapeptide repeats